MVVGCWALVLALLASTNIEESKDGGSNSNDSNANKESVTCSSMPIMGSFNEARILWSIDDKTMSSHTPAGNCTIWSISIWNGQQAILRNWILDQYSTASSNATLLSVLKQDSRNPTLLTFDIPGLVAMDHQSSFAWRIRQNMIRFLGVPYEALEWKICSVWICPGGFGFDKGFASWRSHCCSYVCQWVGNDELEIDSGTTFENAMNSEEHD